MKPGIVMKFGGTSVGTPEAMARAAALVAAQRSCSPLVVLSAVGGVTSLLLEAAEVAREGQIPEERLAEIDRRHRAIADAIGLDLDASGLAPLQRNLWRLLRGISLLRELTPRIRDEVLSFGERVSVKLFAAMLERRQKLRARSYTAWGLGLTTDNQHGCAEPLPACYAAIDEAVGAIDGELVPVVTGFLGRSSGGEITTLGRGGSDLSAVLFAAACGADELQVWTDVNGIMRADPRVVPGAQVLPAIRFEEAAELAYFGAKVLHPRTIEPARQKKIPVRVLGTFNVDPDDLGGNPGTLIQENAEPEPLRALAMRQGVESLQVRSLRMLAAPGFLARIFEIFSRHGISVDVIATSEVSVSMTFDRHLGNLAAAVAEISTFAEVREYPERSIICLVGSGLQDDALWLARVFQILAAAHVPVHVISRGASRINITIVTEPPYAERAMQALHADLFAGLASDDGPDA